jgi:hypothetical protein
VSKNVTGHAGLAHVTPCDHVLFAAVERSCFVGHTHIPGVFVEYDLDATVRRIEAVPELAGWLGDRLRDGR